MVLGQMDRMAVYLPAYTVFPCPRQARNHCSHGVARHGVDVSSGRTSGAACATDDVVEVMCPWRFRDGCGNNPFAVCSWVCDLQTRVVCEVIYTVAAELH